MQFVYSRLILVLWLLWCVYWFAASVWSKPTMRQESFASGALHRVLLLLAVALFLVHPGRLGWLSVRFLPRGEALFWFWLGTVIVAAGLGWSVLARLSRRELELGSDGEAGSRADPHWPLPVDAPPDLQWAARCLCRLGDCAWRVARVDRTGAGGRGSCARALSRSAS